MYFIYEGDNPICSTVIKSVRTTAETGWCGSAPSRGDHTTRNISLTLRSENLSYTGIWGSFSVTPPYIASPSPYSVPHDCTQLPETICRNHLLAVLPTIRKNSPNLRNFRLNLSFPDLSSDHKWGQVTEATIVSRNHSNTKERQFQCSTMNLIFFLGNSFPCKTQRILKVEMYWRLRFFIDSVISVICDLV